MRLFTAIDLSTEVLLSLERLLSALRPEAPVHWSPLDNLHITAKFIGSWPESRLDELHGALRSLPPREPFPIQLADLGWFPNEKSPRVLWCGVQGGLALDRLAADVSEAVAVLAVPKEERPYTPHLTLARIKQPASLTRLRAKVKELSPVTIGSFEVSQFALYVSEPGSNSSIYRKLNSYRFELARAAS